MKRKKMMTVLTCLLLAVGMVSCSRADKCPLVQAEEYVGVYKGLVQVSSEGEDLAVDLAQKVYIEAVGKRLVAVRMQHLDLATLPAVKELSFDQIEVLKKTDELIYLMGGAKQLDSYRIELVEGTIDGDELELEFAIQTASSRGSEAAQTVVLNFNGHKLAQDQSSEAEFKSIRLKNREGELIEIMHTQIDHETQTVFLDLVNVSAEDLKELVAEVEVSAAAQLSPASGSVIDLSAPVEFRIQSEDGVVNRTYTVEVRKQLNETHFDFENLIGKYNNTRLEQEGMIPAQQGAWAWGSSDGGVKSLISLGRAERFGVVGTTDAYKGESAMQIETLDTKGARPIFSFPATPKVTSGSLFLGEFILDTRQPLNSTKFGVVVAKKPLLVKGYYKYKSGETYYHCPNPTASTSHLVEEVAGQKDQGMLAAVLYEVTDPEKESLTGLNIYSSDQIVAMKQLVVSDQDTYQPFELELAYKQEYDPAKTYKFALIFSASKDGDKFSGAPGSILCIDEVKVLSE